MHAFNQFDINSVYDLRIGEGIGRQTLLVTECKSKSNDRFNFIVGYPAEVQLNPNITQQGSMVVDAVAPVAFRTGAIVGRKKIADISDFTQVGFENGKPEVAERLHENGESPNVTFGD
jgi:hypothetical protein